MSTQPEIKLSKELSDLIVDVSEQSSSTNVAFKNLSKACGNLIKYTAMLENKIEQLEKQNKEISDIVAELKKKK